MIEKNAFSLVQQYIEGWKQNNLQHVISCLAENCIIIESHGPTYHGILEIEEWFKFWLKAKSKVIKWNILSFYFCEKTEVALNAVAPGPIETPLFRKTRPVGSEAEAAILREIPLGRIGKPTEIAATLEFLLSEDAAFMTGQTLFVDGGGSIEIFVG